MLRIKDILKNKRLTMMDLAERMGVHRVTLSQTLSRNPTLDTLQRIADALEVPLKDIFSEPKNSVSGYLELNGVVHKISSFQDVRDFLNLETEKL